MGSALVYVIVVGLVAAAVYLLAAVVFGRSEELAPMPPGATPTRLPARDLTGGDVRDLRFQQALRGYKCSEVDWALERLAAEVDALRARVDALEGSAPGGTAASTASGTGTPPTRTNGHAGPSVGPGNTGNTGHSGSAEVADPAPTDPTVPAGESEGALPGTSGVDGRRR